MGLGGGWARNHPTALSPLSPPAVLPDPPNPTACVELLNMASALSAVRPLGLWSGPYSPGGGLSYGGCPPLHCHPLPTLP